MLKQKLIETIRSEGAMRLDTFMERALFDPEEGYYTTKNVFGRKGDFITSPEICQIFGEMIGIFAASAIAMFHEQHPEKVPMQLAEFGPGRGTLMHDMLRTMQFMPAHAKPQAVHMVEASEHLQDQQRHLLTPFLYTIEGQYIHWHEAHTTLPEQPSIIIANEFFDALPVRQLLRKNGAWLERVVGEKNGEFIWQEAALAEGGVIGSESWLQDAKEGDIYEFSTNSAEVMAALCDHLAKNSGMMIVIDYGYRKPALGDTLQAVKDHAYANVLEHVGETDITAHVNFAMLRDIALAKGLEQHALITQGDFLKALGAELRLSKLCQNAEPAQVIDLITGLQRLISPSEMGELFKVLIVASKDFPVIHQWE